jgi:hypothetical protein
MQHCVEIAEDFSESRARDPGAIYIFKSGLNLLRLLRKTEQRVNTITFSRYPENLYNRK